MAAPATRRAPSSRQVLLFLTALSHSACVFFLSLIMRSIERYWAKMATVNTEEVRAAPAAACLAAAGSRG